MNPDQLASLGPALSAFLARYRPYFKRQATFEHCQRYLLGLLTDLHRKSIEPIALAAGVPVRTLQEFLQFFAWDHERVDAAMQRHVVERHGSDQAVGVIDVSAHPKRGPMTPGVQHQWCGQTGKVDNCVAGVHLLYTDRHETNPFSAVLASDLFLPQAWSRDRDRCRAAGIGDELVYRPRGEIALDQVRRAIANGVRFAWLTFDEEFGTNPRFWFALDDLGQRAIGEVRPNFYAYATRPKYRSQRAEYSAKRVDNLCRYSSVFRKQAWQRVTVKTTTRGPAVWLVKHAQVHLVDARHPDNNVSCPTDRTYWLIVAKNPTTGEIKYFVSNASPGASLASLLHVAFSRWHVEKWFERAKQEAGFGAFEVRNYTSLIRHWLCSRLAMLFLAEQTHRLRGEKSADHIRAGGRRGQCPGVETLASGVAVVDVAD